MKKVFFNHQGITVFRFTTLINWAVGLTLLVLFFKFVMAILGPEPRRVANEVLSENAEYCIDHGVYKDSLVAAIFRHADLQPDESPRDGRKQIPLAYLYKIEPLIEETFDWKKLVDDNRTFIWSEYWEAYIEIPHDKSHIPQNVRSTEFLSWSYEFRDDGHIYMLPEREKPIKSHFFVTIFLLIFGAFVLWIIVYLAVLLLYFGIRVFLYWPLKWKYECTERLSWTYSIGTTTILEYAEQNGPQKSSVLLIGLDDKSFTHFWNQEPKEEKK